MRFKLQWILFISSCSFSDKLVSTTSPFPRDVRGIKCVDMGFFYSAATSLRRDPISLFFPSTNLGQLLVGYNHTWH